MNIYDEYEIFFVFGFEFMDIVHDTYSFRENNLIFAFVILTIQIFSSEASPSISNNNSIWINHRYNLENDFTSEKSAFRALIH